MSFWSNTVIVAAILLVTPLASAQTRPRAITGDPSTATHCVSGGSANIHSLGWVDASTNYTVTFETPSSIQTAVGRVNLADRVNSTSYGTPDIARNAATSGTMALFVGGNGQSGCYRYKVAISSGTAATAPSDVRSPSVMVRTAPTAAARTISGPASSAANFNAVAAAHIVNLAAQQSTSYSDDNSGGGTDPALTITAPHGGSLAVHVGGVSGAFGCYRYKVEIR
jgi:hypothetical protein